MEGASLLRWCAMPRTIIIGDVHGCRDELARLIEHVGLVSGDRVVMVGDLIVRGPDPCGTLDLPGGRRDLRAGQPRGSAAPLACRAERSSRRAAGELSKETAQQLRKRDWAWLETLPYWLDLPEHGLRVVHAGLIPGLPIERQDPHTLMYVRCLGRYGEPVERRGGKTLWGQTYQGPPHVVFGHNARSEPQMHAWATGIDTGAVYGGRLTAMVLHDGERVPPPASRSEVLVSVPRGAVTWDVKNAPRLPAVPRDRPRLSAGISLGCRPRRGRSPGRRPVTEQARWSLDTRSLQSMSRSRRPTRSAPCSSSWAPAASSSATSRPSPAARARAR